MVHSFAAPGVARIVAGGCRRAGLRVLGAALAVALAACSGQEPAASPAAEQTTPAPARSLGIVELDLDGLGSPSMSSGLRWGGGKPAADGRAHALALTTLDSGLDFRLQSTASVDVGTRGSGGMRYLSATYQVRNAQFCSSAGTCTPYGVARKNLTFLGVVTPTSFSQSAVSRFIRFDGSAANPALAPLLIPTHGMNSIATVVDGTRASLQVFRENEVPYTPAADSVLPYGFVVINASNGSRTLPANPADQQFDGLVTFAFKIPLQANATDDPFKISMRFLVVEDSNTRVTQSPEEATSAGDTNVAARATAIGATETFVPCRRISSVTKGTPICDVRVAGIPGAPTSTLMGTAPKDTIGLMVNIPQDCYWCAFPLYVNLMNAAEPWRYNWDTTYDPTLIVKDAKGWVTKINGTGVARSTLGYAVESGGYRITWKGKGRMLIASNRDSSVNVDVIATGDGTQSFNIPAPAEIRLDILSTDATDYLRDIVVVADRYAATYQTQPFYPATLAYLRNFRGLRFMDFLVINNSTMVKPADRAQETYYSQFAVAGSYEMAVRLCNAAARDCWLNIPHQANDAFVTEVATLVRDRLDPSLKVYLEYTNEAWNYSFDQAFYMRDTAVAQNVPGPDVFSQGSRYYARRAVQIFNIFQQVFGSTASQRIVRVLGGQSGITYHAGIHLDEAAGKVDAYAVAPYFGNDSFGGFGGAAVNWTLDQLFAELNGASLTKTVNDMQTMQTFLSAQSVPMIAYEAGQHLVTWSGNTALIDLYIAANRDPRMGTLYNTYLDRWRAVGGREMALFTASGPYAFFGSWGLKENLTQPDAQAPKYQAVISWLGRNLKWW